MAVINAYVVTQDGAKTPGARGGKVVILAGTFETVATDSAGSKYRLAKLSGDLVPIQLELNSDSIAGTDDLDIGLYETLEKGGAVKDADYYLDGGDFTGGKAIGSEQNGLADIPVADLGKTVAVNAGDTVATPAMEYDLVLTSNNAVTGAGTISWRGVFVRTA